MRIVLALAAALALATTAGAGAAFGLVQEQPVIPPAIVYFDAKSAELTAKGREQVQRAAEEVRRAGQIMVVIAGHADGAEGSDEQAVDLSYMRATAVREHLQQLGVPPALITAQAFGNARPAVETRASEPDNRRVEITFGPGSGW